MSAYSNPEVEPPIVTLPLRIVLDWLLIEGSEDQPDIDTMNRLVSAACSDAGYPSLHEAYASLQQAHKIAASAYEFLREES